jgi:hypothetical protein
MLIFYDEDLSLHPNQQGGGPPLVSRPQLLFQYIHSYIPYLEAVSSIHSDLESIHSYLENIGVNRMMISKWILKKDGRLWAGLIWLRLRTCHGL